MGQLADATLDFLDDSIGLSNDSRIPLVSWMGMTCQVIVSVAIPSFSASFLAGSGWRLPEGQWTVSHVSCLAASPMGQQRAMRVELKKSTSWYMGTPYLLEDWAELSSYCTVFMMTLYLIVIIEC